MKAVLFDLDGTLVHSDPIHAAVFSDLLAQYGVPLDLDGYIKHVHGRQNVDIFTDLLPDHDPQIMSDTKEVMFRERLDQLKPVVGLPALLDRLRAKEFSVGVVTNAPRLNAEAMLGALNLSDGFDTLVIGDECARGKPDPVPYLTGLKNLNAAAENAIAVEDSPSGIRSAKAAGLYTFGIRTSLEHGPLMAAGADNTILDFNDTALLAKLDRLTGATT